MKARSMACMVAVLLIIALPSVGAESTARITLIEGKVSVLRSGAGKWMPGRPGTALSVGDAIYTRDESFAELSYRTGAVVRMSENTKVVLSAETKKGTSTKSSIGSVWVNARKLVTSSGREFELATPTATAAVRGTVFNTAVGADSSTDVAVYEGKVAVGPGDEHKKSEQKKQPQSIEPTEIPGPEEIPGPYEVTLEEWRSIIAGQRISVRRDGTFAEKSFDVDEAARNDAFVAKNIALDRKMGEEK